MATQKTLEYVASVAEKLQEVLPSAEFTGPHAQGLQRDLTKLVATCLKRSKAPLANPDLKPDIVILDEPEEKPRRKRVARPVPAGTFQRGGSRHRTITYDGEAYEADTIAHGICLILADVAKPDKHGVVKGIDAEGIAAAIQLAYPENNYGPERVYQDAKKWARGVFACQRQLADTEEAASDF